MGLELLLKIINASLNDSSGWIQHGRQETAGPGLVWRSQEGSSRLMEELCRSKVSSDKGLDSSFDFLALTS